MDLKAHIRTIPDYPKPGVMFRDITTLLRDPAAFAFVIAEFSNRYASRAIQKVAAIESRGFIIGAAVAIELGAGFVPIRKKGKLPGAVHGLDYELEYGVDRVEVHVDAVSLGERVLLVDDLIATGGTAGAACQLLGTIGAEIVECCFVIDLPDLGGRDRLVGLGQRVFSLCEFDGD